MALAVRHLAGMITTPFVMAADTPTITFPPGVSLPPGSYGAGAPRPAPRRG